MHRILIAVIFFIFTGLIVVPASSIAAPPQQARNYVENELFVKISLSALDQVPAIANSVAATAVSKVFKDKTSNPELLNGWRKLTLGNGVDPAIIQRALLNNPNVEAVSLNYFVETARLPNDPMFPNQWALNNEGQTGGTVGVDIGTPVVWDNLTSSSNIVVAIIDTGVDWGHEDIAANMWVNPAEIPMNGLDDDGNGCFDDVYGCNYANDPQISSGLYYGMGNQRQLDFPQFRDDVGHGTHVAGIVGAVGNNGIGISGVAWNTKIMAIRALKRQLCGTCVRANVEHVIWSIEYAVDQGANIMNASLGIKKAAVDADGSMSIFGDAVTYAKNNNVLFVVSAMNDASDLDDPADIDGQWYPAKFDHDNLIVVANTDHNDNLNPSSNFGASSVDLGAPGTDITSTVPAREPLASADLANPTGYGTFSGTSMASPMVAGAAAMVWTKNPTWTALQVKQKILDSVKPVVSLSSSTLTGGRLDLEAALDLNQPPFVDLAVTSATATANVATGGAITVEADVTNLGNLTSSPYIRTYFYLSTDDVWSTSDINIAVSDNLRFDPGQTRHITINTTIGTTMAPGTYRLFVYTDGRNNQDEIDDATGNANNLLRGNDVNVTTQVDLAMTAGAAPSSAAAGSQIAVSGTATNVGTGSTYWSIRIYWYLSSDDQYDTSDRNIGYSWAFSLATGQSRVIDQNLNIHSSTLPGNYHLIGVVDPYNKVPEVDSPNNQNGNNKFDYGNFVVTAP